MTARESIRSRANPSYRRFLERKRRARGEGLMLIEGPKLLAEALQAGVRISQAAFSETAARGAAARGLAEALGARRVPLLVLADRLLESLAEVETTQGVVALAEPPGAAEDELFRGTPLLLVACGIQNPGNLGGLLRTAEAAGASGAILAARSADPYSWKSLRGSMGSAFRLPLLRGVSDERLLPLLAERGLRTLAADARAERRYWEADLQGPLALLIGSEARGLPEPLLRGADERLAIPLAAPVESLNAAVAAGVLLFEAARQRAPNPRVLQSRPPRTGR